MTKIRFLRKKRLGQPAARVAPTHAAQMAKHVPHRVVARGRSPSLALLAASLPSYADPIQDPT